MVCSRTVCAWLVFLSCHFLLSIRLYPTLSLCISVVVWCEPYCGRAVGSHCSLHVSRFPPVIAAPRKNLRTFANSKLMCPCVGQHAGAFISRQNAKQSQPHISRPLQ